MYAASSEAVDQAHRKVARDLGKADAGEGWTLVYGGGGIGLMGEVARGALEHGGTVVGVIPHLLADREIAFDEVTELIRTTTMRERKQIMDERSDAFIVLPGGIGTLEELVEMITLKQLGYHDRQIVILDDGGYWDPLIAQLRRMVDEGLALPGLEELWTVATDVPGAVAAIRDYAAPGREVATAEEVVEAVEEPPHEGRDVDNREAG